LPSIQSRSRLPLSLTQIILLLIFLDNKHLKILHGGWQALQIFSDPDFPSPFDEILSLFVSVHDAFPIQMFSVRQKFC
jgi:hypothetical protein